MSGIGLLAITIMSGVLAAVMTLVAWRAARDERRRAEIRIAALSAEIHTEEHGSADTFRPVKAVALRPPVAPEARVARRLQPSAIDDLLLRPAAVHAEPFQTSSPASAASRLGLVAAIGAFAFASLAAIAIWLSPGTPTAPAHALQPAAAPAPLELVALGHERDGDRLNVHGIIRNPVAGGAMVEGLSAVVAVYNRTGDYVMSARAPLGAPQLAPGVEETFQVAVPGAADVGRYRISFRTDDRVVPHVDKREPATLARVQ